MNITRRTMIGSLPLMATGVGSAWAQPKTKMKIYLSCGAIGVKASMSQALDYAAQYGFQAIEADAGWLTSASDSDVARFLDRMKEKQIAWAQAGLPVEFRKSEADFQAGIKTLPATAKALRRAGVERVGTWILPMHAELTYLENFKQHARRLREAAGILGDQGCRLGMEYVGPKTLWASSRYTFIHTMREMKELIAEMGTGNAGIVLDSWHWYTAGETVADLKTLTNHDVISVDTNDAPKGIPVDQQVDGKRELTCATGVIDIAGFLNALNSIGCDAPVRCEPFNAPLRVMPPDQALQATSAAMKKAFALIA
ncbi:MAG: TIM barrel protein [Bryobacteraceae bacterium]|nr:TIM barrel protein [Bryobacteraceae bacterium]